MPPRPTAANRSGAGAYVGAPWVRPVAVPGHFLHRLPGGHVRQRGAAELGSCRDGEVAIHRNGEVVLGSRQGDEQVLAPHPLVGHAAGHPRRSLAAVLPWVGRVSPALAPAATASWVLGRIERYRGRPESGGHLSRFELARADFEERTSARR